MIKVLEPARGLDAQPLDDPRQGGPRAANALFERRFESHWGAVFGVLYRLTGTREEAEDLAQEVFLKLYQRGPRADHDASVGGWLYRVATNLGYKIGRAHV